MAGERPLFASVFSLHVNILDLKSLLAVNLKGYQPNTPTEYILLICLHKQIY